MYMYSSIPCLFVYVEPKAISNGVDTAGDDGDSAVKVRTYPSYNDTALIIILLVHVC